MRTTVSMSSALSMRIDTNGRREEEVERERCGDCGDRSRRPAAGDRGEDDDEHEDEREVRVVDLVADRHERDGDGNGRQAAQRHADQPANLTLNSWHRTAPDVAASRTMMTARDTARTMRRRAALRSASASSAGESVPIARRDCYESMVVSSGCEPLSLDTPFSPGPSITTAGSTPAGSAAADSSLGGDVSCILRTDSAARSASRAAAARSFGESHNFVGSRFGFFRGRVRLLGFGPCRRCLRGRFVGLGAGGRLGTLRFLERHFGLAGGDEELLGSLHRRLVAVGGRCGVALASFGLADVLSQLACAAPRRLRAGPRLRRAHRPRPATASLPHLARPVRTRRARAARSCSNCERRSFAAAASASVNSSAAVADSRSASSVSARISTSSSSAAFAAAAARSGGDACRLGTLARRRVPVAYAPRLPPPRPARTGASDLPCGAPRLVRTLRGGVWLPRLPRCGVCSQLRRRRRRPRATCRRARSLRRRCAARPPGLPRPRRARARRRSARPGPIGAHARTARGGARAPSPRLRSALPAGGACRRSSARTCCAAPRRRVPAPARVAAAARARVAPPVRVRCPSARPCAGGGAGGGFPGSCLRARQSSTHRIPTYASVPASTSRRPFSSMIRHISLDCGSNGCQGIFSAISIQAGDGIFPCRRPCGQGRPRLPITAKPEPRSHDADKP